MEGAGHPGILLDRRQRRRGTGNGGRRPAAACERDDGEPSGWMVREEDGGAKMIVLCEFA